LVFGMGFNRTIQPVSFQYSENDGPGVKRRSKWINFQEKY
jgi:hypothetical protein